MWQNDFEYWGAFESRDGERIGDLRLNVDWIPALRCAEFEQDVLSDQTPENRSAYPVIEPVWSSQNDRPYVGGIRIRRSRDSDATVDFPFSYFSSSIVEASGQLVSSGSLVAGQPFDYRVFAMPDANRGEQQDPGIQIAAVEEPPSIERTELTPLIAAAESHAGNAAAPASSSTVPLSTVMPVFIPQRTFDEATELARRAGDLETGGILVGQLCRGSDDTVFCKVSAQIPAEHTTATRQSLRFTPETWVNVDAAIRLRGLGEIPLGWWHSHPFFCARCTPAQRALCAFSMPAFSAADRDLHREVFQKPWSIALLLSFLGGERPSYDVFAWNRGQIEAVRYFTLPESGSISGES